MADVKKIEVKIGGDSSGLKSATKQANNSLNATSKIVGKLGGALAGTFAVSSIVNFAKKSAELYNIQAKAEAKLLTALKGREGVQQRLIRQASQLQKITLFGDEETIEAQAFLATMGLSEDAIMQLTPLVQDLATKMGSSLTSAADLVAKSVGSSTNALSRYGITIEGAAGSQDRLKSAISALTTQVSGQAEAAAKAGTGGWEQLGNAVGDLQETMGEIIVGEGAGFVDWLTTATIRTNEFLKSATLSEKALVFFGQAFNGAAAAAKVAEVNMRGFLDTAKEIAENESLNRVKDFKKWVEENNRKWREQQEALRIVKEEQYSLNEAYMMSAEGLSFISEQMFGYGANLDLTTGAIVRQVSAYDALLEAAKDKQKQDKVSSISNAMINKELGITTRNAMQAAAATAQLAIANRSSAKEIINAALAVAVSEAIKDSVFTAKNPIVGLLLAGVAVAGVKALFNNIPAFEKGTSFAPGGMALVGERGPEMVNLPRGASVTPSHQIGGGSSGGDIVLKLNEYEFARVVNIASANQGDNVARTTF